MSGIEKIKLVALDSNVFIYHFSGDRRYTEYTNKIFTSLLTDELKAVTSIITVMKILAFPAPLKIIKALEKAIYTTPNLEIIDVDKMIAVEAAHIKREFRFKLPDSVQLACAKKANAEAFITNDTRLAKYQDLKVLNLTQI